MKLTIEMNLNNEAFQPNPEMEVSRILSVIKDKIETSKLENEFLRDYNGNICGGIIIEQDS